MSCDEKHRELVDNLDEESFHLYTDLVEFGSSIMTDISEHLPRKLFARVFCLYLVQRAFCLILLKEGHFDEAKQLADEMQQEFHSVLSTVIEEGNNDD